jgi:large subunit ribosomal protein L21
VSDAEAGGLMYAIVQTGGKQFKAAKDEVLIVEKLDGDEGSAIELSDVMMIVKDGKVTVGSPFVKGARVKATIVRQTKAKKINAFNYKPKKNVRKHWGHRQPVTHIRVTDVIGG